MSQFVSLKMWPMQNCIIDEGEQGGSISSNDVGVGVFTRYRAKGVERACFNFDDVAEECQL